MVNRWSVVLLILGVMAGYLISGTTVTAQQDDALPFAIGDTVTFRFGAPWSAEYKNFVVCTVSQVRGVYVKCAPERNQRPGSPEQWYNLQQSVAVVEKAL